MFPWAFALLGYVLGLTVFVGWFALGHARLYGWVRHAVPSTDERLQHAFVKARSDLGSNVRLDVLESVAVCAPVTVGLIRSVVVFPKGLAQHLDDAELDAVALHETAHAMRHDAFVLSFVALIRAALFFHPLVWIAARQVRVLAEHAADDAVLDSAVEPVSYAKLLTRIAEQLPRRTPSPEYAAGIVLSRSEFIRRVEAILSDRREQEIAKTIFGVGEVSR